MLRPPPNLRSPERLINFGGYGAGKTTGWLEIADLAQRTGSDARFYVVDADRGAERALNGSYSHLENVEVEHVHVWEEAREVVDRIVGVTTENDWIVVDPVDYWWVETRNWWIENTRDQDLESYFMMVRQAQLQAAGRGEKGTKYDFGGSESTDWDFITKVYLRWEQRFMLRHPGHVYLASGVASLARETDEEVLTEYSGHTIRPAGQKRLGYRVHTTLHAIKTKRGWELSAFKDRDREDRWEEVGGRGKTIEVKRFAMDYLVKIGGWKL